MKIAEFCIKHKVTTLLAFIVLSLYGLLEFSGLPLTLLPEMEVPMSVVSAYYVGASPEDVEELMTRPIEEACASLSGLKSMSSTSSESYCAVMLEFEEGTDLDQMTLKLREKLEAVSLPEDCSKPTIMNINIDDLMPVSYIALTGSDLQTLQSMAEDGISPALERIDGIANIEISGGANTQITVEVDSATLSGYGLSVGYITNFLAAENILFPGGNVENGGETLAVSTQGKFTSIQDVKDTLITTPTGGILRLGDIADVYLEELEQSSIAKVNHSACVLLSVGKQSGANAVNLAKEVNRVIAEEMEDYPNAGYTVVYDSSDYINLATKTAVSNIVLGVLIAAVVVFLFLRQFGSTAAIGVSMPVCILTVFALMKLCDLTLNIMSLSGIAMGVGMIVDNSIVVLENINRFRADGYSRLDACVEGSKEVALSITASTFTTVAVFLPIGLSKGLVGQIFADFSLTIAFLLLSSLVIALTLVPLLCYFLLAEEQHPQRERKSGGRLTEIIAKLDHKYMEMLEYLLHRKKRSVFLYCIAMVVCVVLIAMSDMALMPDMDQGMVNVDISTPIGTEVDKVAAYCDEVALIAEESIPEIEYLYYTADGEASTLVLDLVPLKERNRSSEEIAADLRGLVQDIPGCEINVSAYSMASMMVASNDINVQISGRDSDTLETITHELMEKIAALPDAVNISSSLADSVPQVNVYINRTTAARLGLTAATIGQAIRAELTGTTATTVTLQGDELDVVIKGDGVSSTSLDALRSLPVATAAGGYVPLSAVADIRVELAPQSISRVNQSRVITITGDSASGDAVGINNAVAEVLDNYYFPEGYGVSNDSTFTEILDSFFDLAKALAIAIGLIYFILASQFESFIMPVIIMMILPLSLLSGVAALPITGQQVSVIALVGVIMLSGTVVNAAIVLVSYINIRRDRGEDRDIAIMNACPRRVRPVLMTVFTTIFAMIPQAFTRGEGAEMTVSMAVVMITGMAISTLVTLLFTPVFYAIIDDMIHGGSKQHRREKRRQKLAAIKEKAAAKAAKAKAAKAARTEAAKETSANDHAQEE